MKNKFVYLAVLLAVVLSLAFPLIANADGSVVDTPVTPSPYSYLRHSFYAQGLEWLFYNKAGTYYYNTGNITGNVTTWGSPVALTGGAYQDLYFDGTYCHGVGVVGTGTNEIHYRRGEPLGNGSVNWDADALVQSAYSHYVSASVCVDSEGYPYVSAYWNNAPGYYYSGVQFMYGSTKDGTYGTNTRKYPSGAPSWTGECGHHVVLMADDEILLVWSYALSPLHANVWNGSTLEDTVTASIDIAWPGALSVVSDGTDASVVFLSATNNPNNEIDYDSFNMSTNTWAGANTINFTVSHYGFPVLSKSTDSSSMYLAWQSTDEYYGGSGDSIMFKVYDEGVWGSTQVAVLDADLHDDLYLWNLFADYSTPNLNYGVYWWDLSHNLKFSDELNPFGAPYGTALAVGNKTAISATINGKCLSDGNLTTSATFYWAGTGIYTANTVSVGAVVSGEEFSGNITGLIPNTVYWYWVSFANSSGAYLTNTINFQTLSTSGPESPVAESLAATYITNTSAQINGYLAYDGNLPCYLGFRWRAQGASAWTESWHGYCGSLCNLPTFRSPLSYSGTLSNLAIDTTYEYQALVKNGVATMGIYGSTVTFTTSHAAGATVTPTTPGIPGLPGDWAEWLNNLSPSVKLLIALVVTVWLMIMVGLKAKGKNGGILVAAVGGACVVGFTVFGWYPGYVIIIIGGVVALLILLAVAGRGH